MTYREIQDRLGVSSKTVRKALEESGKQGKQTESIEDLDRNIEN